MGARVLVDTHPCLHHRIIRRMRRVHRIGLRVKALPRCLCQQIKRHMVQGFCPQFLRQHLVQFGAVFMHFHHRAVAVAEDEFD